MEITEFIAKFFGFTDDDKDISLLIDEFDVELSNATIDLALNRIFDDGVGIDELRNYVVQQLFEDAVGYTILYMVDDYDLSDKIFEEDFECRITGKDTQFLLNGFEFETKNELKDILQWYKDNYKTSEDTDE